MNKVILIGRLTKDPEIRTTSTAKKVASFSIAISDGKGPNGEEVTQYFDVSAWDKLADITESYLKKGMRVCVVGSLKTRTYDAADGSKRKVVDISARELEILTSRAEMDMIGSSASSSQPNSQTTTGSSNSAATPNQQKSNSPEEKDNAIDIDNLPEIDVNDINVQMPF